MDISSQTITPWNISSETILPGIPQIMSLETMSLETISFETISLETTSPWAISP